MTNQINTQKKEFHFRSKFAKLLNEKNHSIITSAFKQFCYDYDSDCAGSFLWKLTYDANVSSAHLLSDLGLDEIISFDNIPLLRNELRYQYQQHINKNFFAPQLDGSCKKAFDELHHKSDIIVANIVYEHCKRILKCYKYSNEISRILYLLSCNMDNMYYGGIRALDFDILEAEYLKPLHELVHNLLLELHKEYKGKTFHVPEPFEDKCKEINILEVVEDSTGSENPSIENSDIDMKIPQYNPLTPENILLHKDIFSKFASTNDFNILLQIGNLEFDLNKVMINKQKIADFLKAAEALNE